MLQVVLVVLVVVKDFLLVDMREHLVKVMQVEDIIIVHNLLQQVQVVVQVPVPVPVPGSLRP